MLNRLKRILCSNEVNNKVQLNGNFIKKISSGGDELTGRTHGGEETNFTTHFLAICFMNDLPEIKPYDRPVDNRVRIINWNKTYVDNPTNDDELQKDPNIEIEIKSERFQRVFIGMLIQRYYQFMQSGRIENTPEEVINAKINWIGEETEMNIINKFANEFEITNNINDYLPSYKIEYWIKQEKYNTTMKKFAMDLNKYCTKRGFNNIINKGKKVNGKNIQCWFGVKEIVYIEEDEAPIEIYYD
jgi:phage/plasmid-associated DNA primase